MKQDLAASTMSNYRRHIEEHLLPPFENYALADITAVDIDAWEKEELAAGYAPSSVKTWRSTLHLMLADAVSEGLISTNPATKRRGRGKRAGRSRTRTPEKVTTDALGALLIAERAALLSGRDDEFVLLALAAYTGMRWGELVGLETRYARLGSIRVEHQLYELATELVRCSPKDDTFRSVDVPAFLSASYRITWLAARRGRASATARRTSSRAGKARRIGLAAGSVRGFSSRRRPGGSRRSRRSRRARFRSRLNRAPASRSGDATPRGARSPAGHRSRRA